MTDPAPAAEWVSPLDLREWPGNPRTFDDDAVEAVAASVRRFGFGAPIVARASDLVVLAGHVRLAAAKRLGLERVPVRLLDLDEATSRLYALADNVAREAGEWDREALASFLRQVPPEDRSASGFDEGELRDLLDPADAPDEPGPTPVERVRVVLLYPDAGSRDAARARLEAARVALGEADGAAAASRLLAAAAERPR